MEIAFLIFSTLKVLICDLLYWRCHTFVSKVSLILVLPVTLCWIRHELSPEFHLQSLVFNFIKFRTILKHLECLLYLLRSLFLSMSSEILILLKAQLRWHLLYETWCRINCFFPCNPWVFVLHMFIAFLKKIMLGIYLSPSLYCVSIRSEDMSSPPLYLQGLGHT